MSSIVQVVTVRSLSFQSNLHINYCSGGKLHLGKYICKLPVMVLYKVACNLKETAMHPAACTPHSPPFYTSIYQGPFSLSHTYQGAAGTFSL